MWSIDDHSLIWGFRKADVLEACFTPDGKGLVLRDDDWVEEWDTASRERCWKVGDKHLWAITLSSPYEWRHRF